jgi:hypothetical protein
MKQSCPTQSRRSRAGRTREDLALVRRIEPVPLLGDGQKLVRIHQRLVGLVLTVESEFHQQIDQPPHVVEHAREREVEKPVIALGRGRSDHEVLLLLDDE